MLTPNSTSTRSLVIGASVKFAIRKSKRAVPSKPLNSIRAPKIHAGWRSCGNCQCWDKKKVKAATSGMGVSGGQLYGGYAPEERRGNTLHYSTSCPG